MMPMESNDLIAKGDINQWKGFANALRVRMYLRMIQAGIDVADYTAKLKNVVSKGEFFTGNIEYQPGFLDEKNRDNPWYEANKRQLAPNHVGAYPIISYMKITDDPRIAYTFTKATAGDNEGQYVGLLPPADRLHLQGQRCVQQPQLLSYKSCRVLYTGRVAVLALRGIPQILQR